MFIGRKNELEQLEKFKQREQAGLIVCSGRRRVGKSTLIETFGQNERFVEFYGLAPHKTTQLKDQLANFSKLLAENFKVPEVPFKDWHDALTMLANLSQTGNMIILLDEISWMAASDKNFPGILKGLWDTKFKKIPKLIFVLCGSVSSWIEENILQDKGFVGRVSLVIKLEELPLCDANDFWQNNPFIDAYEKFKVLCVTGGIPRYLEEINPRLSAEENIKNLCFTKGAVLVKEFDTIFNDIFQTKASDYKAIVKALLNKHLTHKKLCEKLHIEPSGNFSQKLKELEESGFICREFSWNMEQQKTANSQYRLKDNYIRFYLKYIEPKIDAINQGLYEELHVDTLPDWHSMMGLAFENLVLNNLSSILKFLNVSPSSFISAAPYYQQKTKRTSACQIDLLIQTRYCYYICEIKFRKHIDSQIINEILEKIEKLKVPKTISVRPVLIFQGELAPSLRKEGFFSHLIDFSDLLKRNK